MGNHLIAHFRSCQHLLLITTGQAAHKLRKSSVLAMFNVCTSGPLPKTGQHPHLADSSHSLPLQQTLTASASSHLQPDSFPSYLYCPLHLAVAANGKTNTHSSDTMLSLRIFFPSKPPTTCCMIYLRTSLHVVH